MAELIAMTPLPKDHPLMIAWEQYKATDDYQNTRRWALHDEHVDGSLWAAFMAGFNSRLSECEGLREELERERLRLSACGVAALENTPETSAKRIGPDNPYYSASYADVCTAVDREMALREERDVLQRWRDGVIEWYGRWKAATAVNGEEAARYSNAMLELISAERDRALRVRKGDGNV